MPTIITLTETIRTGSYTTLLTTTREMTDAERQALESLRERQRSMLLVEGLSSRGGTAPAGPPAVTPAAPAVEEGVPRVPSQMREGGRSGRNRRRNLINPPSKQRRGSPYDFFRATELPKIKALHPAGFTLGGIGKELGKRWRELSDQEKAPFQRLSAQEKERLKRERESRSSSEQGPSTSNPSVVVPQPSSPRNDP